MEFGAHNGETGRVPDEGQRAEGQSAEEHRDSFGGDSVYTEERVSMTAAGGSALEHVPEVSPEISHDEVVTPVAQRETLVQDALKSIALADVQRDREIARSDSLTDEIERLTNARDAADDHIGEIDAQAKAMLISTRAAAWETMDKDSEGAAHGPEIIRTAVQLTPTGGDSIEAGDVRVRRVDAALAANVKIMSGVPAVMRYSENYGVHYQGGVPAHDGFVVIADPNDEHTFKIGITEPVAPVEEAWVPEPPSLATGAPWYGVSGVEVHTGDDVVSYLRQECLSGATEYMSVSAEYDTRLLSPGGLPAMESDKFSGTIRRAADKLVRSVNTAHEMGVLLLSADTPPSERRVVMEALTAYLFDRLEQGGKYDLRPIGEALRYVHPDDDPQGFAGYLAARYKREVRRLGADAGIGFKRYVVADLLVDICGMEPEEAYRLVQR